MQRFRRITDELEQPFSIRSFAQFPQQLDHVLAQFRFGSRFRDENARTAQGGRLARAGANADESGIGRVIAPKRFQLCGQGRTDSLDMGQGSVGAHFRRGGVGKQPAGAEGDGAQRAVVEPLFHRGEKAA